MMTVIGVMGGGERSTPEVCRLAYRTGYLIAREGWVLLNGGRPVGVMEASARGAKEGGGLTVGILPGRNPEEASAYIDIPIPTGMGDARNCINVLASQVVIALPGGAGTLSEIALALKSGKKVVLLNFPLGDEFKPYYENGQLIPVKTPEEAVAVVRLLLRKR